MTWVTPIKPLERGELWCVWEWDSVYEWMAHPETARELLANGILVDGEWCRVEKIDEWPGIGAWQLRATKPSRNTEKRRAA